MRALHTMRAALTATLAVSLFWAGQQAHAQLDGGVFQPLFATTSGWSGYGQSAYTPNIRGASTLVITSQTGRQFAGQFLFNGATTAYQGTIAPDGAFLMQGAAGTGFQATGATVALGDGGFVTRFSYQVKGNGEAGTVELLHLFAYDATMHAFPPGPCDGTFTSAEGSTGGISFARNDARSDTSHTTAFHGALTFGSWSYNVVGTISPQVNRDGSYTFDLIGQPTQPGSFIPCVRGFVPGIHIMGRYLPGTMMAAPARVTGQYSLLKDDGSQLQCGLIGLLFR